MPGVEAVFIHLGNVWGRLLCAKLCASHMDISAHLTLTTTSAAEVVKTPHFTDGQTEAQGYKVDDHGVELGFALTSVLSPVSVSLPSGPASG